MEYRSIKKDAHALKVGFGLLGGLEWERVSFNSIGNHAGAGLPCLKRPFVMRKAS
jgi:hypothetical protein